MRRPIDNKTLFIGLGIAAAATIGTAGLADNPECESFDATQPQPGSPSVKLLYTWDAECGADPGLGPLERDNAEIDVAWSHDTSATPHAHTAWDEQVPTGVRTYRLTVSPQGLSSYVLSKSLLVAGTSGADTDPDTDEDDTDTGADADTDEDTEDKPKVGGTDSSGCRTMPRGFARGLWSLLLALG